MSAPISFTVSPDRAKPWRSAEVGRCVSWSAASFTPPSSPGLHLRQDAVWGVSSGTSDHDSGYYSRGPSARTTASLTALATAMPNTNHQRETNAEDAFAGSFSILSAPGHSPEPPQLSQDLGGIPDPYLSPPTPHPTTGKLCWVYLQKNPESDHFSHLPCRYPVLRHHVPRLEF